MMNTESDTENIPKKKRKILWWMISIVTALSFFILCWYNLSVIACFGVQYKWSNSISISILESLGPSVAGDVFYYHNNFDEEQWDQLVTLIVKDIDTNSEAESFVCSLPDINIQGYLDNTPLIFAVERGKFHLIELMIRRGANVNTENSVGVTPLSLAAPNGRVDATNILIEHGANLNHKDRNGKTILDWAIQLQQVDTARLLIENGVDINTKGYNDLYPLHAAICYRLGEIIELLIEKGVNINAKTPQGDTPLDFAVSYNFYVEYLRKHGGKTGKELDAEKATSKPAGTKQ